MSASIRACGVSKTFSTNSGSVDALRDIDLEVSAHRFVSIIGPSGCGKSTFLRIVAGLTPASSGEILIDATPVRRPASNVGFAFQTPVLLPWRTVLDNVELYCGLNGFSPADFRQRSLRLIEMVGLSGFENSLPYQLSGGMQQRVALCRSLLHDPGLLLMDEPFAALDLLTRETMMGELQRIWMETQKTVLFVTHSIAEAVFLSDEVLVMSARPGTIIERLEVDAPRPRDVQLMEDSVYTAIAAKARAALSRSASP